MTKDLQDQDRDTTNGITAAYDDNVEEYKQLDW